ncbi:MAG: NAD(+) synthase [Desulfobacterales bacterium]
MAPIKLADMDCELVCRQISDFVVDSVLDVAAGGCVVGLSGGVDSSTTAALIHSAFDLHNRRRKPGLELVGYILPTSINRAADTEDAESLAALLGIRCEVHQLEPVVEAFRQTNPEAFENDYHQGNMIARIRANVLNTKAATEGKIVAGTGNRDEDFGIGYYTLFGDGAVHISPIAGLPKRLVRKMGAYLGLNDRIVHRAPTAGLEPGQSDFKDLGYDYDVVELVTEGLDQGLTADQLIAHEQIKSLVAGQIEAYRSSFGETKFETVGQVVEDIARRHRVAQKKFQIVHAPSPAITLTYQ